MALSDVSIGDFMPRNSMMPDLRSFGSMGGTVDTGFHQFAGVTADSGMTDINTTAMSPFNPYFAERQTDRPAYDSATDPFREQMRQAARVGNAKVYVDAQDAIRRIDDTYGIIRGEMGVNDRESMDAVRYGQGKVAGRGLGGVDDQVAKMQSVYIAEQAIRRGRHVRDLEGEETQLDTHFDYSFDQAFGRASSNGRFSAETAVSLEAYRNNPAEKEMRKLSAKRALQEVEKTDGNLYALGVRQAALQKYCEYFAMSKAFGAFGTLDDKRIMREAVDSALGAAEGKADRSIFAKFNEACARYGDGFFTYSDSPTADETLGMQTKDSQGNTVSTGFIPVLRQVFEQQAAEDLMNGKGETNYVALSEKLAARLQDRYGYVAGRTDPNVAGDVWKRIAGDIVEQSKNGHVDCSRLATLYVKDRQRPIPPEFKTADVGLFNTLSSVSGTLIDEYMGGRPAYYGKWYWPFGDADRAQRDRFEGEVMRKGVDAIVGDSLASLGPKFLKDNKAYIDGFKSQMAGLIEYGNKFGDPTSMGAGEIEQYKNTAQAITTALSLAANMAAITDGKFKPTPMVFGKRQNNRWYVGRDGSWGDDRYRGRTHSFENAFDSLKADLEGFIKANPFETADEKTKIALTVAQSYLTGISRIGEATGDEAKVGKIAREGAREAVRRSFGGIDPFTGGAQMNPNGAASFSPYNISAVADSENARAAAYAGLAGMVTNPDDMVKQQLLNRFIQAAYSDKLNPVDFVRASAVTETLLAENCSGMAKNAAMMDVARRELGPAVTLAMRDAGHFVLQGAADGDVEVDDPNNPGKKMKAVKAFVPTASIWDDARAVEVLRKRLRPTLGRLKARSDKFAADELAAFEARRTAAANIQLQAQQAKENELTQIPGRYANGHIR